jgi:hypothetical protein
MNLRNKQFFSTLFLKRLITIFKCDLEGESLIQFEIIVKFKIVTFTQILSLYNRFSSFL